MPPPEPAPAALSAEIEQLPATGWWTARPVPDDGRVSITAETQELAALYISAPQLQAERAALAARCQALEAALELLADPATWEPVDGLAVRVRVSDIARAALRRAEPGATEEPPG